MPRHRTLTRQRANRGIARGATSGGFVAYTSACPSRRRLNADAVIHRRPNPLSTAEVTFQWSGPRRVHRETESAPVRRQQRGRAVRTFALDRAELLHHMPDNLLGHAPSLQAVRAALTRRKSFPDSMPAAENHASNSRRTHSGTGARSTRLAHSSVHPRTGSRLCAAA